MTTDLQNKIEEMEKLIAVLKDQIYQKDMQIQELVVAYSDVVMEIDSMKRAVEAL
jgi:hypothetical protein